MAVEKSSLDAFKESWAEKKIDASRKLRIGIIGTGWIAAAHIKEYLKMPDVELVAGADIVPGKARKFLDDWGCTEARAYETHTEMLEKEELDAVSVCTYNATHAVCSIDAMRAGVHVMLEKPMSVTLDEALEMRRVEKETGMIFSIGFQPRFSENYKLVKKIVQSGELGRVYYIQTGGGRRRGIPTPFGTTFIQKDTAGVGALGDIGCYSLDLVLNAIGYPKPLTVSGYKSDLFGKNPDYWTAEGKPAEYADLFGVDDFGAGFIRLEGGIVVDFRIAWAMHIDSPGDTVILGTKAALRIPAAECWNGSPFGGPLRIYREIAGEQVCTEIAPVKETPEGCFYHKLRSFLDAVKEGGRAPVSTDEIIYNQAIIDGLIKSAELGREIEINIPEI